MAHRLPNDIPIQAVSIDRLILFPRGELEGRRDALVERQKYYAALVVNLGEDLVEAKSRLTFLTRELEGAETALKIQSDDLVRVACPECKGSGMRPVDVLSARVVGSAFETVGSKAPTTVVIDERNRCEHCTGRRWVIMERYRG